MAVYYFWFVMCNLPFKDTLAIIWKLMSAEEAWKVFSYSKIMASFLNCPHIWDGVSCSGGLLIMLVCIRMSTVEMVPGLFSVSMEITTLGLQQIGSAFLLMVTLLRHFFLWQLPWDDCVFVSTCHLCNHQNTVCVCVWESDADRWISEHICTLQFADAVALPSDWIWWGHCDGLSCVHGNRCTACTGYFHSPVLSVLSLGKCVLDIYTVDLKWRPLVAAVRIHIKMTKWLTIEAAQRLKGPCFRLIRQEDYALSVVYYHTIQWQWRGAPPATMQ